jgi:hypothetical protein
MRKNVVEKKKNEEIDQKNVKLKMWLNYFILLFIFFFPVVDKTMLDVALYD